MIGRQPYDHDRPDSRGQRNFSTLYPDTEGVDNGPGIKQKWLRQLSTQQSIQSHEYQDVLDHRPGIVDKNQTLRNTEVLSLMEHELLWTLGRDVEVMGKDHRSSSGKLFTTFNGFPDGDEKLCRRVKFAGVNTAYLNPMKTDSPTPGLQVSCQVGGSSSVHHTGTTTFFPFEYYSAVVDRAEGRTSTTRDNRRAGRQLPRVEVNKFYDQPKKHLHPVGMCLAHAHPGADLPTFISPGQMGQLTIFTNEPEVVEDDAEMKSNNTSL